MIQAKWISDITIIDPDTKGEVEVSMFKHDSGGIIGIDASFIEQMCSDNNPIINDPFNKGLRCKLNFEIYEDGRKD